MIPSYFKIEILAQRSLRMLGLKGLNSCSSSPSSGPPVATALSAQEINCD